MAQAKTGDTVRIHYTGTLEDGTIFDSSDGRDPLEFTLGAQQVIPGFDKAVSGMNVGDSSTTTIPPEEAYGEHNPELLLEFGRDQLPPELDPEIGMQIALQHPNGQPIPVVIVEVSPDAVILDANHQLAGKTLIFDVELVEII